MVRMTNGTMGVLYIRYGHLKAHVLKAKQLLCLVKRHKHREHALAQPSNVSKLAIAHDFVTRHTIDAADKHACA